MSKIRPLYPHAALLLINNYERYVIISDLHIGFEEKYRSKGIVIDDNYIYEMIDELSVIADKVRPTTFIILGDIKDSIGKINKNEWKLIPEFLEKIRNICNLIIIPGNHDNNIRSLVPPNVSIASPQGLIIDDTLLMHGHTIIRDAQIKRMVMGHLHARVVKEGHPLDGERAWIFLRMKSGLDVTIMPAFNKYLTTKRRYEKLMRIDEIDECLILTLDGSIIGDENMLKHILI